MTTAPGRGTSTETEATDGLNATPPATGESEGPNSGSTRDNNDE